MSKVDILRLDSVTASDTTATASINTNFKNIQDTIETLLSRDGATPNYMQAVLDMNSNRIINTADPVDPLDVVNLKYVQETLGDLTQYVTAAQNAATAAEAKAQSAASSATAAASSAQAAIIASQQAVEAEGHIEQMLQDPNLVAVGEDLRSPDSKIEAAIDAAEQMLSIGYGTSLSYDNDMLQLLDQNGNALGSPVMIDTGTTYVAGEGIQILGDTISVTSPTLINAATVPNSSLAIKGTAPGSSGTAIGVSSFAQTYDVAVGSSASAMNYGTTAIGYGAAARQNYSTALGYQAVVTAPSAIQLGKGSNSETYTFYTGMEVEGAYKNYKLLDYRTGLIPNDRLDLSSYATTTYVDNIVGDVEALLHSINIGA